MNVHLAHSFWVRNPEAVGLHRSSPISNEITVKAWPSLKAWPVLEEPLPSASSMVIGRKPQLLAMWNSPQGRLRVLMVWQLASPWASNPRQGKKKAQPEMPFMSQPCVCYLNLVEISHLVFILSHILKQTNGQIFLQWKWVYSGSAENYSLGSAAVGSQVQVPIWQGRELLL